MEGARQPSRSHMGVLEGTGPLHEDRALSGVLTTTVSVPAHGLGQGHKCSVMSPTPAISLGLMQEDGTTQGS